MMCVKRRVLRFSALAAVGLLGLAACASDDGEQPDSAPTDNEAPATSPVATEVDLDQFAAALVTDAEVVGVAQDPPIEGFADDPVTMYLTLSEFEPTGRCASLLEELNSFSAPAVGGVSAKFIREVPDRSEESASQATRGAAVETMIFETTELTEPMAIYRDIPNACETLTSSEVEGAEATFTKVPGLDALHLEISDGQDVESLAVGGSSVNARFHMYMTAEQVTLQQAQDMFGAQAEKLQETFRDRVDSAATPSPTAEPSTE
ncbi:hypothetical protein [Enteractinococcus coprophilus]|nr:hypothetical protein [Enteractinococcus coprophilus]